MYTGGYVYGERRIHTLSNAWCGDYLFADVQSSMILHEWLKKQKPQWQSCINFVTVYV